MCKWRSVLKADPTSGFLEKDNAFVRYRTLTSIFEIPANDQEVDKTRDAFMKIGAVPFISARQVKKVTGINPRRYCVAKYKGTIWQLIILTELHADGTDQRIKRTCEFILQNLQNVESGGILHARER